MQRLQPTPETSRYEHVCEMLLAWSAVMLWSVLMQCLMGVTILCVTSCRQRLQTAPDKSECQPVCIVLGKWNGSTHNASDGNGLPKDAGISALLQEILEGGQIGQLGVVRHVRDPHERRPARPMIELVDLHVALLHQELHAVQLQHTDIAEMPTAWVSKRSSPTWQGLEGCLASPIVKLVGVHTALLHQELHAVQLQHNGPSRCAGACLAGLSSGSIHALST